MRWVAAVWLLAGCGRIGFDAGDACGAAYTAIGDGCYRVSTSADVAWTEAESACEMDGPGCHLVVLDAETEMQDVSSITPANAREFWIGVSDRRDEGTYLTVTGAAPIYLAWSSGQPDGEDDHCVRFSFADVGQSTETCDNADDFICECDGIPADPASF